MLSGPTFFPIAENKLVGYYIVRKFKSPKYFSKIIVKTQIPNTSQNTIKILYR